MWRESMSMPAISVEDLGKKYKIGLREKGYDTLRDALTSAFSSPLRRLRALGERTTAADVFWALRGISFDVQPGEVIGIIGRNGAGKSTLLKILSRITEPTEGVARIRGRVGSLLEVGTGFHPELTGRENVYLNGAILGMKKKEIDAKFDEIVAFAGVDRFLDTPVKRYSSGMRVRLAFAVAAHLQPETLIIDEVLAVGDAAFQHKCLGKMGDVAKGGRTVLFVSHNMAAISSLCTRAMLLDSGALVATGLPKQIVDRYLDTIETSHTQHALGHRADRVGGVIVRFQSVDFLDADTRRPLPTLISGQDLAIRIRCNCQVASTLSDVVVSIGFFLPAGPLLFACRSDVVQKHYDMHTGDNEFVCRLAKWPLSPGRYTYNIIAYHKGSVVDWVRDAGSITVESGDYYGSGRLPAPARPSVLVDYRWGN
jgi:lipopolysaccharide transport system ATP-binding protein